MRRSPLHNCCATATPHHLKFHKQQSVHVHLAYSSKKGKPKDPLKRIYFSEPGETVKWATEQTVATRCAGGCPPKTQTILNKVSDIDSPRTLWKESRTNDTTQASSCTANSLVLGVTRNHPPAMNLGIVQTLCVIRTPIVFSLSWGHDNTKFQNAIAEQSLCTEQHYCPWCKTFCKLC